MTDWPVKSTGLGFAHELAGPANEEWYTPKYIFDALGLRFDLDPASPGAEFVPWIPAAKHYTQADNGLVQPWEGKVWLNPPYGIETPHWLRKFIQHGNGVMLVFARTDTGWFHASATKADALCFIKGRVQFVSGAGKGNGSGAGAGSLLLAMGDECATALMRCGLGLCIDMRERR